MGVHDTMNKLRKKGSLHVLVWGGGGRGSEAQIIESWPY